MMEKKLDCGAEAPRGLKPALLHRAREIRPRELVTKLDWVPDRDPAEIGRELIAKNHIHPPTNCSGCHR